MTVSQIPVLLGFLVFQAHMASAQAAQDGEPTSAASILTGANVNQLAFRLNGVPSVPIAAVNQELERRGVETILERPYDQAKIDKARDVILDLYRGLGTGPIYVTSYARRLGNGTAEVIFVIRSKTE